MTKKTNTHCYPDKRIRDIYYLLHLNSLIILYYLISKSNTDILHCSSPAILYTIEVLWRKFEVRWPLFRVCHKSCSSSSFPRTVSHILLEMSGLILATLLLIFKIMSLKWLLKTYKSNNLFHITSHFSQIINSPSVNLEDFAAYSRNNTTLFFKLNFKFMVIHHQCLKESEAIRK